MKSPHLFSGFFKLPAFRTSSPPILFHFFSCLHILWRRFMQPTLGIGRCLVRQRHIFSPPPKPLRFLLLFGLFGLSLQATAEDTTYYQYDKNGNLTHSGHDAPTPPPTPTPTPSPTPSPTPTPPPPTPTPTPTPPPPPPTPTPTPPPPSPSSEIHDAERNWGLILQSPNGVYQLFLQSDGNLVVNANGSPIWATATHTAWKLSMQSDGNLILYDVLGHPVWTSNTEGNPHSKLVLQDDGNLVIYDAASGRPLWTRGNGRLACNLFSNIQANPGSIYIPRGQVNLDFDFTYSLTVVASAGKQDPIIIHLRGPAGDFKIATYYSIPPWSLSTTEGVLNGGFKFYNSQAGTYRIEQSGILYVPHGSPRRNFLRFEANPGNTDIIYR
jgi:hypothetical protein